MAWGTKDYTLIGKRLTRILLEEDIFRLDEIVILDNYRQMSFQKLIYKLRP
jgi:hypothetical protein